jgi:hypothetical protein
MKFKKYAWILLPILFIACARLSHKATGGFRISKVVDSCGTVELCDSSMPLAPMLEQPFTYLGRGLQGFAFSSADGKYVLKLMNNKHQRRLYWLGLLPFFPAITADIQQKLERAFGSYALAWNELRSETGLIAIHLAKTDRQFGVATIVDRLGIRHPIDLDTVSFVIQKRATSAYTYLAKLQHDEEKMRAIVSILDLIVYRFQKGIADNDPLIRTNVGFVEGKAILIDIGPFSKRSNLNTLFSTEFLRITASLKDWVARNAAHLSPFLDHEIARRVDEGI